MSSRNRANNTIKIMLIIIAILLVGFIVALILGTRAHSKASTYSAQLDSADAQYAELQSELDTAKEDNAALQSTVEDQNTTIAELQEEILNLRGQLEGTTIVEDEDSVAMEEAADAEAKDSEDEQQEKESASSSEKKEETSSSLKSDEEKKQEEEQAEAARLEEEQKAAEAAKAAAAAAGHTYTDAAGNSTTFTADEWAYLESVWAYTGQADEMISHHTVGELRSVLSAR